MSEVLLTVHWLLHGKGFINCSMQRASRGPWLSSVPLLCVQFAFIIVTNALDEDLLLIIRLKDTSSASLTCLYRMLERNFAEWLGCKSNTASNASFNLAGHLWGAINITAANASVESLRVLPFLEIMSSK